MCKSAHSCLLSGEEGVLYCSVRVNSNLWKLREFKFMSIHSYIVVYRISVLVISIPAVSFNVDVCIFHSSYYFPVYPVFYCVTFNPLPPIYNGSVVVEYRRVTLHNRRHCCSLR